MTILLTPLEIGATNLKSVDAVGRYMAHAVSYMQLQSCSVLWQFLMIKQNLCSCLDEIHSLFWTLHCSCYCIEFKHKETVGTMSTLFCLTEAKILQQLSKIQNNVKRLQQQLKDVKPTPECKL